jgi:hypothetical protein
MMGKASRLKRQRSTVQPIGETHEPQIPRNWPHGHVGVELTGDDQGECIEITVHGVKHYLHSTTARELSNMLLGKIDEWNSTAKAAGVPTV